MHDWQYPVFIAHRGAGKTAPENTLAAFAAGRARGYSMFECDVRLSSDGVPFLLHDHTLNRTTSAHALGLSNSAWQPWSVLSAVDAGSWHSPRFAGQPLLRLEQLASFCTAGALMVNLEIKPYPGDETRCGSVVARMAEQLWQGQAVQPLLSSFSAAALTAAHTAAPSLPRALLAGSDHNSDLALAEAQQLGCMAVVYEHTLWTAAASVKAKQAGMMCLAYTVNQPERVQQLLDMGLDGIITDAVDTIRP